MLFRDTTGDPEAGAIHAQVAAESRAVLLGLLAREPGAETLAAAQQPYALDMVWEILRGVLQGLALWWHEHQDVPRGHLVSTAMNTLWIGFERALNGESWPTTGQTARATDDG